MSTKDFTRVDVHAIDEDVVCYFFENDKKEAMMSLSVSETEDLVKMLEDAIEVAKKSKYYCE